MVEVEAHIHRVMDLGVIPTPGAGPILVQRGITSIKVSTLGPISMDFVIISFNHAHDLAQDLGWSWRVTGC
jgi:hypothetical protein